MSRNETLRQELLDMRERDQTMRKTIMARYGYDTPFSAEDAAWFEAIDAANTARMKEIIAEHGWPGQIAVGQDGATSAWLLVQHADKAPEFQRRCLELMQQAVAVGEASASNFAYLTDRVRVAEGQPQIYGTQNRAVDGKVVSEEIEDAAQVDNRRAAVGLGPIAEYLASMNKE